MMFQTHTPVEALTQRVIFRWFAARRMPRVLLSYVVGNWISRWRQDVKMWKEKIYRPRPLGTESDGPQGRMRKWYGQFYPDGLAGEPTGKADRGDWLPQSCFPGDAARGHGREAFEMTRYYGMRT